MFDWSDVTRRFKDLASLIDTKPVFRWGVITNADPLLVQLDGDDRPLAGSPSTIIGGLSAGERVLCMVQNRRVTVIGRGGADNSDYVQRGSLVTDWQNIPLASGWTATPFAQWRTDGHTVRFRGNFGRANALPVSWTRATGALPLEVVPDESQVFMVTGGQGAVFRMQIYGKDMDTPGAMYLALSIGSNANRAWVDGVTYEY